MPDEFKDVVVGSEYDRINRLAERAQRATPRAAELLQRYLDHSVQVVEQEAEYQARLARRDVLKAFQYGQPAPAAETDQG